MDRDELRRQAASMPVVLHLVPKNTMGTRFQVLDEGGAIRFHGEHRYLRRQTLVWREGEPAPRLEVRSARLFGVRRLVVDKPVEHVVATLAPTKAVSIDWSVCDSVGVEIGVLHGRMAGEGFGEALLDLIGKKNPLGAARAVAATFQSDPQRLRQFLSEHAPDTLFVAGGRPILRFVRGLSRDVLMQRLEHAPKVTELLELALVLHLMTRAAGGDGDPPS
jgi:hypothetical protein